MILRTGQYCRPGKQRSFDFASSYENPVVTCGDDPRQSVLQPHPSEHYREAFQAEQSAKCKEQGNSRTGWRCAFPMTREQFLCRCVQALALDLVAAKTGRS